MSLSLSEAREGEGNGPGRSAGLPCSDFSPPHSLVVDMFHGGGPGSSFDWRDSRDLAVQLKDELLGQVGGGIAGVSSESKATIKKYLEAFVSLVSGLVDVGVQASVGRAASGCTKRRASTAGLALCGSADLSGEAQHVTDSGSATGEGEGCSPGASHSARSKEKIPTRQASSEIRVQHRPGGTVYIEPKVNSHYKDLEEVKKDVLKALDPAKKGLQLRRVIKTRSGGIIIEVGRGEDRRRILGDVDLLALKVVVKEKPMLKPRIIVRRAPRTVEGNVLDLPTLTECLRRQNFGGEVGLNTEVKLLYRSGQKSKEFCNLVLEVNPRLRTLLLKSGGVYLGSHFCVVGDHVETSRCYKCQRFGHISRSCAQKAHTCGHCGESGHCFLECTKNNDPPCCPNCKKAGIKDTLHMVSSRLCPTYLAALGRIRERTDYGF